MAENGNGTKLGQASWISFGLFVMAIGGAISITWFLASFKSSFDTANMTLASMDKRLESVEEGVVSLRQVTNDRWTGTDMKLWVSDAERALRAHFPELNLPEPVHEQR